MRRREKKRSHDTVPIPTALVRYRLVGTGTYPELIFPCGWIRITNADTNPSGTAKQLLGSPQNYTGSYSTYHLRAGTVPSRTCNKKINMYLLTSRYRYRTYVTYVAKQRENK